VQKACDFTRAGRPAAGGDRVGSSTNRARWIRQLVRWSSGMGSDN